MRANNVSFNHDSSCVVLATENGFRILKADSGALLHKFDKQIQPVPSLPKRTKRFEKKKTVV